MADTAARSTCWRPKKSVNLTSGALRRERPLSYGAYERTLDLLKYAAPALPGGSAVRRTHYGMIEGMHRLLLWDIDGTLIKTVGTGTKVMGIAFEAATGTPLRIHVGTAGRTERAIFAHALAANGVQGDFDVFAKAEAVAYREHAEEMRGNGRVLSGVIDALVAAAADTGVVQTLLTGNTKECADIKVTTFGLADHFDLHVGAYGDDDAHRPNLVPIAQGRATDRHGHVFAATETVVIGDTPSDVEAAHAHGARAIAVATGSYSVDELAATGADVVLADLSDTDAVMNVLFA